MIETDRLILKPLTFSQLLKYIRNDNSLEKELNLSETSRNVSAELKEALELTILPNAADINKNLNLFTKISNYSFDQYYQCSKIVLLCTERPK